MFIDPANQVATLIKSQFPDFYQEQGPLFIAFVEAYYEWLQQPGNPLYMNRQLLNYRDIDQTLDQFLIFFKNKYLPDIQFTTESNKRLLIKNSLDLYRSKGSPRSVDLLFRLVYGVPATVYYPDDDVLRLDDNEWIQPIYLEVTHQDNNYKFVGQQITGLKSSATAFVERLVRKRVKSKYIDVFYLSNISGNFKTNEMIRYNDNVKNLPIVIGSLSGSDIVAGGELFSIGEIVNIISAFGDQAQAIVTGISEITGIVDFQLFDGGWGYQVTDPIYVSDKVLSLSNINISNVSISNAFLMFETITQPVGSFNYSALTGASSINVGTIIEEYNTAGAVVAFGTVMQTVTINSTAGTITVAPGLFPNGVISDLTTKTAFAFQGNTATATRTGYTNASGSGKLIGYSSNNTLDLGLVSGSFVQGEMVYQGPVNSPTATGNILSISDSGVILTATLSLINCTGTFYLSEPVVGILSGAFANLNDFSTSIGVINTVTGFISSPGNYVVGSLSNTVGSVFSVSRGELANVSIGSIDFPQDITLPSDLLSSNNIGNVPYVSVLLDGSNSNVASNGYGFPTTPSAGYNSTIYDSLAFQQATVGSIASLANVNPGIDYTAAPFNRAYDAPTTSMYLFDYEIDLSSVTGSFAIGEQITQAVTVPNVVVLGVTSANAFRIGEAVYTANATANLATGICQTFSLVANVGTVTVNNVTGTFAPAQVLIGKRSNGHATIANVTSLPYVATAIGIVKDASASTIHAKRISLTDFNANNTIIGSISGASATPVNVVPDLEDWQIGLNADIQSSVQTSTGAVTNLDIIQSGYGFSNGELATFQSLDKERSGSVQLLVQQQGEGSGYFKSHAGMLDDDPHFFDGIFYQQYAYQILSRLPFDTYKTMLKKVLHPVGTIAFGRVMLDANTNNEIDAYDFSNTGSRTVLLSINGMSNAISFRVGDTVMQNNIPIGTVIGNGQFGQIKSLGMANNGLPIRGTSITQPTIGVNTATAIIADYVVNTAANTTTYYTTNLVGSFISTEGYGLYSKIQIDNLPIATIGLTSVITNVYATDSFANGETVYQGSVDSMTATGIVLAANNSLVVYQPLTGTIVVGNSLNGMSSLTTANVAKYNGNSFNNGDTLYIQSTLVKLANTTNGNGSTGTFAIGENIYQQMRSKQKQLSFTNTAVAHVVAANDSSITVQNRFGHFANGQPIYGDQSNTSATIIHVTNTDIHYGIVQAVNSTATTINVVVPYNPVNVQANTLIYTGNVASRSYAIANDIVYINRGVGNTLVVETINNMYIQTFDGKQVDETLLLQSANSIANAQIVWAKVESL